MDKEFLREIDQVSDLIDTAPLEKLADETLICECFCVSVGDIRSLCAESGVVDLEQLRSTFHMGTGCRSCLKKTDYWINKVF